MEDKNIVRRLKKSDEKILEVVIEKYNPYVSVVIANQIGGFSDIETIEELASDVFLALWQNRMSLSTYHLRGWLGTTSRNKAKSFLRKKKLSYEPLDDNSTIVSADTPFSSLEKSERSCLLKRALLKISSDDREIIIRHYYYNQTVNQISDDMKINAQTVKSKLLRGRNKLKEILERGGDLSELGY